MAEMNVVCAESYANAFPREPARFGRLWTVLCSSGYASLLVGCVLCGLSSARLVYHYNNYDDCPNDWLHVNFRNLRTYSIVGTTFACVFLVHMIFRAWVAPYYRLFFSGAMINDPAKPTSTFLAKLARFFELGLAYTSIIFTFGAYAGYKILPLVAFRAEANLFTHHLGEHAREAVELAKSLGLGGTKCRPALGRRFEMGRMHRSQTTGNTVMELGLTALLVISAICFFESVYYGHNAPKNRFAKLNWIKAGKQMRVYKQVGYVICIIMMVGITVIGFVNAKRMRDHRDDYNKCPDSMLERQGDLLVYYADGAKWSALILCTHFFTKWIFNLFCDTKPYERFFFHIPGNRYEWNSPIYGWPFGKFAEAVLILTTLAYITCSFFSYANMPFETLENTRRAYKEGTICPGPACSLLRSFENYHENTNCLKPESNTTRNFAMINLILIACVIYLLDTFAYGLNLPMYFAERAKEAKRERQRLSEREDESDTDEP
eukprot:gene7441-8859_t